LRHAECSKLKVDISLVEDYLYLQISNDSMREIEGKPKEGRGMRNIRSRAAEVGGSAAWRIGKEAELGGYTLEVFIPLQGGRL
jgi:signal transduction histidine kinase